VSIAKLTSAASGAWAWYATEEAILKLMALPEIHAESRTPRRYSRPPAFA
jgi:hypothetical protein